MNETIKSIKGRRSIRKYKEKEIPKDILEELVDCARLAPSARNDQPLDFVVITNKGILKKLQDIIPNGPFLGDAAACIAICGDSSNHHTIEDGCAATENILIAVHSLGLGACWVAGYNRKYNDEAKEILGIPEDKIMVAFIPMGYPNEEPAEKSKRDLNEVLHWEKY
jgi:nitroreductase